MKKAIKQSTLSYILNFSSILLLIVKDRFELTQNANRFMNGLLLALNPCRSYQNLSNMHFILPNEF